MCANNNRLRPASGPVSDTHKTRYAITKRRALIQLAFRVIERRQFIYSRSRCCESRIKYLLAYLLFGSLPQALAGTGAELLQAPPAHCYAFTTVCRTKKHRRSRPRSCTKAKTASIQINTRKHGGPPPQSPFSGRLTDWPTNGDTWRALPTQKSHQHGGAFFNRYRAL